jgi:hypothetical protein
VPPAPVPPPTDNAKPISQRPPSTKTEKEILISEVKSTTSVKSELSWFSVLKLLVKVMLVPPHPKTDPPTLVNPPEPITIVSMPGDGLMVKPSNTTAKNSKFQPKIRLNKKKFNSVVIWLKTKSELFYTGEIQQSISTF